MEFKLSLARLNSARSSPRQPQKLDEKSGDHQNAVEKQPIRGAERAISLREINSDRQCCASDNRINRKEGPGLLEGIDSHSNRSGREPHERHKTENPNQRGDLPKRTVE